MLFAIYPHLAAHRRRGTSSKEVFQQIDPQVKKEIKDIVLSSQSPTKGFHMDNTQRTAKSFDKASAISGKASAKNSVNFQMASTVPKAADPTPKGEKNYGIPTLKMLNPELYKEIEKQERQMKDPTLLSVRNIKERYSYHEIRVGRIQKRTDELTKELEAKNDEMLKKSKARQMKQLNDV